MKGQRHSTPFREGDRVTVIYHGEGHKRTKPPVGTFEGYCRGFLSHCMVRWDNAKQSSRVAVHRIRLLERPTPEV